MNKIMTIIYLLLQKCSRFKPASPATCMAAIWGVSVKPAAPSTCNTVNWGAPVNGATSTFHKLSLSIFFLEQTCLFEQP